MLTLQILAFTAVVGTILGIIMYKDNYKDEAAMILSGCWGSIGFILFLIFIIGIAPQA